MKKYTFILVVIALFIMVLSGCGNKTVSTNQTSGDKKISVVTTIFPEYDWVKNILGDKASDVELTLLLDKGVDLHSYQPTTQDIMKISSCDLFIYVGGESDEWVEDALKEGANKDQKVINLLEVLGDSVKEEEVVEGMEHEHDHDHEDADHDDEHDHEEADHDDDHEHEEVEYDEHVWLSLNNAKLLCDKIAVVLGEIDKENAELYKENAKKYSDELMAMDTEYRGVVDKAEKNTILFADRFPFRYMTEDYGLDYYAAFSGCSAETEASFNTIVFLAGKVDELKLPVIMTIEKNDHKIAETVRENTGSKDQEILELDSMQSITGEDIKNGTTYLSVMKDNLEVLKQALR